MKKINRTFIILIILLAMVPPWDLTWRDENGNIPFHPDMNTKFSGYHFISYYTYRPTQMLAWDAKKASGTFDLRGHYSINTPIFFSELAILCVAWALIVYVKRKKNKVA